jgi:hypothetical protein
MIEEHKVPLSMHKALNNATNQMAAIKKRLDFVRSTDTMSIEQKTEETKRLRDMRGAIARQVVLQADRIGALQ